jgi:hypothetical protein
MVLLMVEGEYKLSKMCIGLCGFGWPRHPLDRKKPMEIVDWVQIINKSPNIKTATGLPIA